MHNRQVEAQRIYHSLTLDRQQQYNTHVVSDQTGLTLTTISSPTPLRTHSTPYHGTQLPLSVSWSPLLHIARCFQVLKDPISFYRLLVLCVRQKEQETVQ
jgi:hypothetical protein